MRYLRNRRARPVNVQPNSLDVRRIAEMEQERCDTCTMLFPASEITVEDGVHRCPNDVDYWTAGRKAAATAADAAWIGSHQDRPQRFPPKRETFAAVTRLQTTGGTQVYTDHPLSIRAGSSGTLVVKGVGLTASDTVSGAAGFTITPTVDSSTQVTLSVAVAGGTAAADYPLTYNEMVFRGVFRVR